MSLAKKLVTAVVSSALVLASCASKPIRDDEAALAGKKVDDASAVKVWHEGEQEAGVKSEPAAAPMSDVGRHASKEVASESATPSAASVATGWKEVFPFVRVDAAKHEVEFDAEVPAYAYVGKDGVVYLEVLVCTRDTREHEALLVTGAKASDVHAALLMAGLVPGAPGGWEWKEKELLPIAPKGESVEVVSVLDRAGVRAEESIGRWVKNLATGALLDSRAAEGEGFVFAGSGFVTRGGGERYAADGAGTLVGLATFGTETIAWKRVFSPESSVDEPVWAVDRSVQPEAGTKVKVLVRRAKTAGDAK